MFPSLENQDKSLLNAENPFQPIDSLKVILESPFFEVRTNCVDWRKQIHHIYLVAFFVDCVSFVHDKIPLRVCVCVCSEIFPHHWLNSISQSSNGCSTMYWKYVYLKCPFHGYCAFFVHGWIRIFNTVYLKGYFHAVLAFGLAHPTIWQLRCISEQSQYVLSELMLPVRLLWWRVGWLWVRLTEDRSVNDVLR